MELGPLLHLSNVTDEDEYEETYKKIKNNFNKENSNSNSNNNK